MSTGDDDSNSSSFLKNLKNLNAKSKMLKKKEDQVSRENPNDSVPIDNNASGVDSDLNDFDSALEDNSQYADVSDHFKNLALKKLYSDLDSLNYEIVT